LSEKKAAALRACDELAQGFAKSGHSQYTGRLEVIREALTEEVEEVPNETVTERFIRMFKKSLGGDGDSGVGA
jgi:hypothetical protein